jgi:hypothetical protein
MNAQRRELRSLLRAAAAEARLIAERLGAQDDWQYPAAVALGAYITEHAEHLSAYLQPERIEQLAWRVTYQAGLCTRELAPLEPLLQRASIVVWEIRADLFARRRPRALARRLSAERARDRRPAALRALFAG